MNTHRQTHKTRRGKMQNRPHIQKNNIRRKQLCKCWYVISCLLSKGNVFFVFFFLFVLRILMNLDFAFFGPFLQTRIREPFATCRRRQGERIISQGRKQTLAGWLNIFFWCVCERHLATCKTKQGLKGIKSSQSKQRICWAAPK